MDERPKRYIRDVGEPLEGGAEKASASFGMVAFALAAGFVVGLAVWAVYRASAALTDLLWVDGVGTARELLVKASASPRGGFLLPSAAWAGLP